MALALKQTHGAMGQNQKPKPKARHAQSTNFQQRHPEYTMRKGQSLQRMVLSLL